MAKMSLTLLPCGSRFRMGKQEWSTVEPVSKLADWIKFYKRMSERHDARGATNYRAIYGPDYAALRVFQKEING